MNCGPMSDHATGTTEVTGITEDAFLDGRLRLRQPGSGHRAGHDAMLLAAATAARAGDRVVELGAGVGAAGLALAARVGAIKLTLVEIDPALAALARENAAANAIAADVAALDVAAAASVFAAHGMPPDSADAVLMNPPFNDATRHRASPDAARATAHVAGPATLEDWIAASRRILKSGAALTLIWRADGLTEVLAALARGFGSLAILPVHGDQTKPAIRILVRAIKGGKAPTQLLAGVALNDESRTLDRRLAAIWAGEAGLLFERAL
ncbi:MAG: methyltransferase [Bradyrhizobium sp.]|uniref:methyltransferase n=1 Tax=Bradyrhizobium sp. TaxID=376 RepID=UPI001D61E3FA|nr:methyltransferase [Bradyrhizobium sp.]MBV9562236.1 methyltransferase [Bradyrhizobium sp.]